MGRIRSRGGGDSNTEFLQVLFRRYIQELKEATGIRRSYDDIVGMKRTSLMPTKVAQTQMEVVTGAGGRGDEVYC